MSDISSSSIRKLLSRSSSTRRGADLEAAGGTVRPELIRNASSIASVDDGEAVISKEFLRGYDLLRVTRKKTRSRNFTLDPDSGTVCIDGTKKFSVDAIRDIRVGAEASHYRELCKISSEHELRWLSIVYYLDRNKLKVLHVICPNTQILEHFQGSLMRLYQKRSRFLGAGHAFFGPGHSSMDEDMWQSLIPVTGGNTGLESAKHGSTMEASNGEHRKNHTAPARMTFEEVEALCHRLYFNAPTTYLRGIFRQVDKEETGYLNFPAFKKFVEVLKFRHDISEIYRKYKVGGDSEMTREEFIKFLTDVQGLHEERLSLDRIFEKAREPASEDRKESISSSNFTEYVLSRQNAVISTMSYDMTRPLNEYYISSSHNTYLTGRQVGDESSVEPYIRALQKGCRCIEIDIWSNSDGFPEVRHGRTFTSSVSLEAVLKAVDKYAFIVSPWPLIISLEIRCGAKAQEIVLDMLVKTFGEVLLTVRPEKDMSTLPSPEDLRHRILLKVKSTTGISNTLKQLDHTAALSLETSSRTDYSSPDDDSLALTVEDSSMSTAPDSDLDSRAHRSRTSSVSSRSSSYSSTRSTKYRPFGQAQSVIPELTYLAPFCKAIKFRNFSLPESKVFNHVFSISERTIKQFSKETSVQVMKHNTRYLMRVYPSQTRLMSSNFLPHQFWQRGVQMVALNWQTHDLGMKMNDAFFAIEEHSADVTGYVLKPKKLRNWDKGQDRILDKWATTRWTIEVISGTQLPKGQGASGKVSPSVEMEVIRPAPSSSMSLVQAVPKTTERERESKFKTCTIENNGFNPRFNTKLSFVCYDDEDPYFTFLRFVVKDTPSGDILGQCVAPMTRLQQGYRSLALYDVNGERFIFSALFLRISSTAVVSK